MPEEQDRNSSEQLETIPSGIPLFEEPNITLNDDISTSVKEVLNKRTFPINEDKIRSKITEPEKAEEFTIFAQSVIKHLPFDEMEAFADDPINFTSQDTLFRGLTPEKYEDLKTLGEFKTYSGSVAAGHGVFLSNSPYSAFTYQTRGVICMIGRDFVHLRERTLQVLAGKVYTT